MLAGLKESHISHVTLGYCDICGISSRNIREDMLPAVSRYGKWICKPCIKSFLENLEVIANIRQLVKADLAFPGNLQYDLNFLQNVRAYSRVKQQTAIIDKLIEFAKQY